MARPNSEYPTELELQILKVLWEQSPQTVREVRDTLAVGGRDLAHTSVITTLGIEVCADVPTGIVPGPDPVAFKPKDKEHGNGGGNGNGK